MIIFNFSELLTIATGSLSVAWNIFHKSHRPLLWCFMVLFHPFWTLKKIQLLFTVIFISEWTIPWNAIMLIYKIIMLKHWSHWDIGGANGLKTHGLNYAVIVFSPNLISQETSAGGDVFLFREAPRGPGLHRGKNEANK